MRDAPLGTFLATVGADARYGWRALKRARGSPRPRSWRSPSASAPPPRSSPLSARSSLKPLPYRDPGRLAVILHHRTNPVAPANFFDWRRESRSFEVMGAAENWTPNLTGGSEPQSVQAVRMNSDVFRMLGIATVSRPRLPTGGGRPRAGTRDRPGARAVAAPLRGDPRPRTGDPPGRRVLHRRRSHAEEFDFPPFWATGTECGCRSCFARGPPTARARACGSSPV